MTSTLAGGDVHLAASLDEAIAALAELGDDGAPLAGGTWVMRARLRGADGPRRYVGLGHVRELQGVSRYADGVVLGALLTHTELAMLDPGLAYACVREAALESAFPQVRNVATVGGNIGAAREGFAEADLMPALLAADASVELAGPDGLTTEPLAAYLATQARRPSGELVARVRVPVCAGRASAFERLSVRAAAEYPVVNVAVSVDVADGIVTAARVAVGSVEPVARLCPNAAASLVGHPAVDPAASRAAGEAAVAELTARDGLDAPGWYRLAVLPALVRRAAARLATSPGAE